MHRIALVAVSLLLAGCNAEESRIDSDAKLAGEIEKDKQTNTLPSAYLDCVKSRALQTPNGREAMDLNRIAAVQGACEGAENAAMAAIQKRWPAETDRAADDARRRGVRAKAIHVVRENPYDGSNATNVSSPEVSDPGLPSITFIETPLR